MVKFRLQERQTLTVMMRRAQAIHRIRENIERHGPMVPQRKAIGHPAISSAEIQHIQRAACLLFHLRKYLAFKIAIASAANGPLRRISPTQILIGKGPIIRALARAPAFGEPDSAVVFEKPLSGAYWP